MNHDCVLGSWLVMFVALRPVVAEGVSQIISVPIKGCARDGRAKVG